MATVTPNFNWPVPTSTDLVKDGATAIEALGDSIDASLVDLKGGTTGQVLSKNSNTDMDFTWVTDAAGDITGVTAGTGISGGGTSGTVTVTNSMATAIDAKGDLVPGTGADTFARLAVGANGTVLTADSAETTGLKWTTPASGGMTLLSTTSLTGSTVNITGISTAYKQLQIVIRDWWPSTGTTFYTRFNNNSTANAYLSVLTSYRDGAGAGSIGSMDTYFNNFASNTGNAQVGMSFVLTIPDYATTASSKVATGINYGSGTNQGIYSGGFVWKNNAAITEFNIGLFAGNFSGGTVLIYGVN
jgi:hypothetical protein